MSRPEARPLAVARNDYEISLDLNLVTPARRLTDRADGPDRCSRPSADERAFRGSLEPGADVIREVASMSAPVGRTPLPTKWSE
ncbi:hypothetical protein Pmi06nite_84080 [Planotetraspora mira]|uniref:Uncharacterized protein n=1 Tax=Planotetraspora mira TaxID=58121 RepID=A0A8J3U009_9ACTN|nr:hypothetical protein Pmi06nite_84080 [Planotetraspora mira]